LNQKGGRGRDFSSKKEKHQGQGRFCNPTDININILSSPWNNRTAFPTHSSATTEKMGACNQQDFQRTNVYSKDSTLIINITQPSLNNPKLPHKFQRLNDKITIMSKFPISTNTNISHS
jgi:hypothetical protein